jgi:transposase
MRPVFANGNRRAVEQLLRLRKLAQQDKAPRVVLRIQGILMSLDGLTTTEIADRLKIHRSTVPLWIEHWNDHGEEGLWEGQRSGRPSEVDESMRQRVKHGFNYAL